MAVADEAVQRKASVAPRARSQSVTAAAAHTVHSSCTAPPGPPGPSLQSGAGLQLAQIAATGTEKTLLADVTEEDPDASYIELLRLFKARRRRCLVCRCQRSLHLVYGASRLRRAARAHLVAAAAPYPDLAFPVAAPPPRRASNGALI
jgi:hypothetical protein